MSLARALALLLAVLAAFLSEAFAQTSFSPSPLVKLAVNPVTNKVYVANESDNSVTAYDETAGTSVTIPVGQRPQFIAVNPVTNRVYVNSSNDSSLTVIDGATDTNLTPTPLALGTQGPITVNAATDVIYVMRMSTPARDEVTFFNGATNEWYTVATGSFEPTAVAVNPVTDTIFVAHYATGDVRVISGAYDASDDFPSTVSIGAWSHPFAIAANPVTNKVYVLTQDARGPIGIIDGATLDAQFPLPAAGHARNPQSLAVNPVTNKVYAVFQDEVVVIDGATNGYTYVPIGSTGTGPTSIAVNAGTNQVYVATSNGSLVVIDGATNATTPLSIPAGAVSLALDPVTNVAYTFGDTLTRTPIATAGSPATPIASTITPLPGDTSGPDPSFTLSASSGFSPTAPALTGVYYQLDATAGPWTAATGTGPYSASFSGLAPGAHTLNVFATDLQLPVTSTGSQSSAVLGPIASFAFTVSGTPPATPTLSLASSANPAGFGQAVTFTVSVSGTSGTPTGSVTFRDAGAALAGCGAVALTAGSASCTASSLAAGSHPITVQYSGDAAYTQATSSTVTQVVKAATTTGIVSSANPSTAGQPVTFTVSVAGGGGTPGGTVSVSDGAAAIAGCSGLALDSGSASCTTSALATGMHSITATYAGDANFEGSVSGALSQSVSAAPANATVGLASSANPSTNGQAVTFTVTVTGGAGTATGTVTIADGGTTLPGCGGLTLASSTASCSSAGLAIGNHTLVASYGGDGTYDPGTSAPFTQAVNAAPSGALGIAPATVDFGGQSMGTTSLAHEVALTNNGTAPLTISGISTSDPQFAATSDCATLAPGAGCTLTLTFTPGSAAVPLDGSVAVQATVSIASDASPSPGAVAVAGSAEKSLVTHYYQAILRRDPDAGGKQFWMNEATRLAGLGANVNEVWYAMATSFLFSPEYLSQGRDDAGFVTDLYNTFFNRPPDASGLAFWTQQMASGTPRGIVLVSFMFSPEFQGFTQDIFGNTAARAEVDVVGDFYRGLLARLPDDAGFTGWVNTFRQAQCGQADLYATVGAISSGFMNSPEYTSRNRSNADFVGDLYNAFLRRGGDQQGVLFWINQLNSGAMTRDQVRQQFIASPEFGNRVQAIAAQGCTS